MENMTKYELIKDLPTFKKGEIFVLLGSGLHRYSDGLMAYPRAVIDKYPNILEEWFRDVKEDTESQGPWEPKEDEEYYRIDGFGGINEGVWDKVKDELDSLAIGNIFRSKKDADKALAWLKARKVLYDDAKGFEPNWRSRAEFKWMVSYEWSDEFEKRDGLVPRYTLQEKYLPGPHFATEEDARASIKAHEKEWKIYLLRGEE